jgi:penicillin-binding protein 1A
MIRRVTTYDGALLEQAHPAVHDVIPSDVARTMVAMLEEVVQFGTGQGARALGRPSAGKTGTTNDFTDAWYEGFVPQITAGVWVGYDDKQVSLGKHETGAVAALPIWLEFMQAATSNVPVEDFPNVVPLEKVALTKSVRVDTPDTAPTEEEPSSPADNQPSPSSAPPRTLAAPPQP